MEKLNNNSGEYYKSDYTALVAELGPAIALQKVAMYQKPLYANIPCVRDGRLLQTFRGLAPRCNSGPTIIIPPPEITEADFKDNTDKGLTNLPCPDKFKLWQQKQQAARRARHYV